MEKIILPQQAIGYAKKLKAQGKSIVLAGGVFDILHPGHISFLEKAKEKADILILLLESDEKVQKLKGQQRPINSQEKRAQVLAGLSFVDYIILLPYLNSDSEYDALIEGIKPDIIATTHPDPYLFHKQRQAKKIGALVIEVIGRLPEFSTTKSLK